MIITLKDGSKKNTQKQNPLSTSRLISAKALQELHVQGEVDGEVVDLRHVVDKDCELSILGL